MNWLPKINKSIIKYISLSYVNVGLNVLINLILINKTSAYDFGKISIGKTIFQSYDFTHLGIRNGFDRLFPQLEGKNVVGDIFSVGFISTFVVSLLFLIFWSIYKSDFFLFYSAFSVSGIIYSLTTLYRIYYRAQSDKKKFVSLSFYTILVPPLCELIGFLLFNVLGYVIAFFASYIFLLIFVQKKYAIKLNIKKKRFILIWKKIQKKGWLLFLSSLIAFFSTSADRFFIESYWGLEAVGRFSVIMFFFSVFRLFPVNYTEMIMNRLITTRSFKYASRHILFLFLFMLIIVVLAFLFLPFLIKTFMPNYKEDIELMRIVIWAVIPFSLRSVLFYYMHGIDKRKTLLFIDSISTILYFVGLIFTLKHTNSFEMIMFLKLAFYILSILLTFTFALMYSRQMQGEKILK
ncbi:MATE_Wzx_like [Proteiniphilum saccharofermentans]|uniref:MATE_Wzx_like n=1 Tax=Proteiniphilum saccharofermentans TaxID=1642647 RepID=A0A1R3T2E5_9BACT|nr:hypothetical protein [Proteiniphilum saccharofermentans]SCD20212.1 MATE_Wzx_like [Proteiniphilum saccharofermentans]